MTFLVFTVKFHSPEFTPNKELNRSTHDKSNNLSNMPP